jgi:hypothetical protein
MTDKRSVARLSVWFALATSLFVAASSTAQAQQEAPLTWTWDESTIGYAVGGNMYQLGGDLLVLTGWTNKAFTVTTAPPPPTGTVAVAFTLWKWNGTTSVQCRNWDWLVNPIPGAEPCDFSPCQGTIKKITTGGCGPGQYNLAIHGASFEEGSWHFATTFTGWMFASIP